MEQSRELGLWPLCSAGSWEVRRLLGAKAVVDWQALWGLPLPPEGPGLLCQAA